MIRHPRTWTLAALAATLVAVLAATALIANHRRAHHADPLHDRDLARWQTELAERPDPQGKDRFRQRDAALRGEFWARQEFARRGAWVLLAGAVLAIGLAKLAHRLRERPFDPSRRPAPEPQRTAPALRWGAAAGGAVLLGGLGVLAAMAPADAPAVTATPARDSAYPARDDGERLGQWPGFRGPAAGVASGTAPLAWSATSGVAWKAAVPLPGVSSPVAWDDIVYLTGGDGKTQEVFAFSAGDGALLWRCAAPMPPGNRAEPFSDTGWAAPTPATDGRSVVALFATGTLAAVDANGSLRWVRQLGTPDSQYGLAASPVIWRDLVLVQLDQGGAGDGRSALIACSLADGRERWRAKRPVPAGWASPVLAPHAGGWQVLTCGDPWVIAYDPADGRELWRVDGLGGEIAPSPAFADGTIFAANANARLLAVRGATVAWSADGELPDTASPVASGGMVAIVDPAGTVRAFDAADGGHLWDDALGTAVRASPLVVGDRLYAVAEDGTTHILAWARGARRIASCPIGEPVSATPALHRGRLYLRGREHLFCISGTTP